MCTQYFASSVNTVWLHETPIIVTGLETGLRYMKTPGSLLVPACSQRLMKCLLPLNACRQFSLWYVCTTWHFLHATKSGDNQQSHPTDGYITWLSSVPPSKNRPRITLHKIHLIKVNVQTSTTTASVTERNVSF
jgi:hypothetical protein